VQPEDWFAGFLVQMQQGVLQHAQVPGASQLWFQLQGGAHVAAYYQQQSGGCPKNSQDLIYSIPSQGLVRLTMYRRDFGVVHNEIVVERVDRVEGGVAVRGALWQSIGMEHAVDQRLVFYISTVDDHAWFRILDVQ
jgi:hypothetical protein